MADRVHEEHEDGLHKSVVHEEHPSVMRRFIDLEKQWVWTKHFGICDGSHCQIGNNFSFVHKGKIRDGRKAAVDWYKVDNEKAPRTFGFRDDFIAKTLHDRNEQDLRDKWISEVNAMKGLRHPHIAAFLGTWEHLGRLSILIYPVACCDLHDFMTETDAELQKLRYQSALEGGSLSDVTLIDTSGSMNEETKLNISKKNRASPSELPCPQRLMMIRRFFPCLCQALSYIHRSGLRHKDIKPENILIDQSGNVIIADFGIARRFPLNEPHDTNDEWLFSWKYASPEMIERTVLRGDPSDVYSLGCVFLEMATLMLGESFKNLIDHYVISENEIKWADRYYLHLDRVYSWIEHLRSSRTEPALSWGHELDQRASSLSPFSANEDQQMVDACLFIRNMLSRDPDDRPKSKELFQSFASVALQPCRDCDPRHPNVWKETAQQKERAKRSSQALHSLRLVSDAGFFEVDEGPSNPGINDNDEGFAQAALRSNGPSRGRNPFPVRSRLDTIGQNQAFEPSGSKCIPVANTQTNMDTNEATTSTPNSIPYGLVNHSLRDVDGHNITSSECSSPNIPLQFMRTPPPNQRLDTTARFENPPNLEVLIEEPDARAADLEAGMKPFDGNTVNRGATVMIYDFEKKRPYIAPFWTIEGLSALCSTP